ncbi:MAG: hypothetical protein AAB316_12865, partial [Bacteroidota bacterium]
MLRFIHGWAKSIFGKGKRPIKRRVIFSSSQKLTGGKRVFEREKMKFFLSQKQVFQLSAFAHEQHEKVNSHHTNNVCLLCTASIFAGAKYRPSRLV